MSRLLTILILGLAVVAVQARSEEPTDDPPQRDHAASAQDQKHPGDAAPDKPRRDDRDHRRGRDRFHLSEEEAEQALQIITRLKPELGEELARLREDDPRRFARELEGRFPRFRWLLRLNRFDPEMFELRMRDIELYRRSRELAEQVRDARRAGRSEAEAAAREQLDGVVAEHFDVRQQIREAELARLERRLAALRDQLADRTENRRHIIAEHTESLIEGDHHHGQDHRRDDHHDDDRGQDRDGDRDDG